MKSAPKTKLYSLVFPVWLLLMRSWMWVLVIPLNFAIDSLVLLIIFKAMHLEEPKKLYRATIFKTWIFGILSSFLGALFMMICFPLSTIKGFPEWLLPAINALPNAPVTNVLSFIWVMMSIAVSALICYFLNVKLTFNFEGYPTTCRKKSALIVAICTAPYTFLIPNLLFK